MWWVSSIFCIFLTLQLTAQNETDLNYKSDGACGQMLIEYEEDLRNREYWALEMFDATSKLQAGILSGNLADLGAFDQCIGIDYLSASTGEIKGKYCLGVLSILQRANDKNVTFEIEELKNLAWSICIPDACNGEDAAPLASSFFSSLNIKNISVEFDDGFCHTKKSSYPKLNPAAIVPVVLLSILLGIILFSSVYDYFSSGNEKFELNSRFSKLVKIFSVLKNGRQLFSLNKNSDQLQCLNGLRVISLFWIILLHEYAVYTAGPTINSKYVNSWMLSFHSIYVLGGSFAVDTFFVLGGLLVGYNYQKSVDRNQPFNLLKFYFHRIFRVLPALAVVVLISATLLQFMGSGPYWPLLVNYFQASCQEYWWSTILLIQNYVNVSRMCVGHSWYLNVDMHLYIISPIILLLSKKWRKISYSIAVVLILGCTSATFAVTWIYQLDGFSKDPDYMNQYYLLSHTRAAPWLIGLLLGLEIKNIRKIKLKTVQTCIIWTMSIMILFACGYVESNPLVEDYYSKFGNAFAITLARPAWAIAICLVIIVCLLGRGGPVNAFLSLNVFQILGKLSYSMYLISVSMMYVFAYGTKNAFRFSDSTITRRFWGDCMYSMVLAMVLVLGVEYPALGIEKMIF